MLAYQTQDMEVPSGMALTPGFWWSRVEPLQQMQPPGSGGGEVKCCCEGAWFSLLICTKKGERRGRVGRSVITYSTLCTQQAFDLMWIAFFPPAGTFLSYVPRGLTSSSQSLSISSLSEVELCLKSKTTWAPFEHFTVWGQQIKCFCFGFYQTVIWNVEDIRSCHYRTCLSSIFCSIILSLGSGWKRGWGTEFCAENTVRRLVTDAAPCEQNIFKCA